MKYLTEITRTVEFERCYTFSVDAENECEARRKAHQLALAEAAKDACPDAEDLESCASYDIQVLPAGICLSKVETIPVSLLRSSGRLFVYKYDAKTKEIMRRRSEVAGSVGALFGSFFLPESKLNEGDYYVIVLTNGQYITDNEHVLAALCTK